MTRESKIIKRLVALFLLGCVLFNYPILSLFNLQILRFGLPMMYVYLFGIWCLLIGLTAWATMIRSNKPRDDSDVTGGQ